MTDYIKATNFALKDNQNAVIVGAEFETEFNNISTSVNSKVDALAGTLTNSTLVGTTSAPDQPAGNNTSSIANTKFVTDAVDTAITALDNDLQSQIDGTSTLERAYPVGSIYMNAISNVNPAELLGFGSWVDFADGRVLVGASNDQGQEEFRGYVENGNVFSQGGEKEHTLTINEMPSHDHDINVRAGDLGAFHAFTNGRVATGDNDGGQTNHTDTLAIQPIGGNQPHNNLQPYISIYMWRRTA